MKELVQSSGLAISAGMVPPVPLLNSTWLAPWVPPKSLPSMITVLPIGPEGWVAPLMLDTSGGPDGSSGPVVPPPPHPIANRTEHSGTMMAPRIPEPIASSSQRDTKPTAGRVGN